MELVATYGGYGRKQQAGQKALAIFPVRWYNYAEGHQKRSPRIPVV